jgi:glycosyltransferase involved in cell wall biosynthesis
VPVRTNRTASIALVGNSLPRRCGIATFTNDLQRALRDARPDLRTGIVAMNDRPERYDYPDSVVQEIEAGDRDAYAAAAAFLNGGAYEAVSLQHEFGIFGGESGANILSLLERLRIPAITTLHTVLENPTPTQRAAIDGIAAHSSRIVVMAEKGREFLTRVYGVPPAKIACVPHGIPDFPFVSPDAAKAERGFAGRHVILTFGLLSPNKGIEVMIDAMPAVLARCPTAVYVVLGATHPNLVREHGEAYRHGLAARARDRGVEASIVFIDGFVDHATLLSYISMCDVYVTPYLNEVQMTSGTLAYSYGLGRAVVSTPYWHARDLLADGRGVIVPFGDSARTGDAVSGLLADDRARDAMRARAYRESRPMVWTRIGERYLELFDELRRNARIRIVSQSMIEPRRRIPFHMPELRTGHLEGLCDDTGLFQHAIYTIPDRLHGYCVDDNARALLLASMLAVSNERALPVPLVNRFAAFVQHAWNPATRRFRNFLGFDRNWTEASGSEDSHARTLWALGVCARNDPTADLRRWAAALFAEALPGVESFTSPRAWAFALLGINAFRRDGPADDAIAHTRKVLADRLMMRLADAETPDMRWFEESLAYDNARLSQALIETGAATATDRYSRAGLRTLEWLNRRQTSPSGCFRPAGTQGFGRRDDTSHVFDQQPVDAAATIAASFAAWHATGDIEWIEDAARAFVWFHGHNDLSTPLVDNATGACRDGLHPDRPNENCGAESAVSYLLGLVDIRRLVAETGDHARAIAHLA